MSRNSKLIWVLILVVLAIVFLVNRPAAIVASAIIGIWAIARIVNNFAMQFPPPTAHSQEYDGPSGAKHLGGGAD